MQRGERASFNSFANRYAGFMGGRLPDLFSQSVAGFCSFVCFSKVAVDVMSYKTLVNRPRFRIDLLEFAEFTRHKSR